MRLVPRVVSALLVGTVLGLLATWLTVFHMAPARVRDGPWQTDPAAGSARSGPYMRAFIAVHGLFALDRDEAVYYSANTTTGGHALAGNCRYTLSGGPLDAEWWSITAYGSNDFLIPNPANRYSVSQATVSWDKARHFVVQVASTGTGENWLPVEPGRFSLTLRLYNPGAGVLRHPGHVALPVLRRVSCP